MGKVEEKKAILLIAAVGLPLLVLVAAWFLSSELVIFLIAILGVILLALIGLRLALLYGHAGRQLMSVRNLQQAILDNVPDFAWLKDQEGRYIAVNRAFAEACGHPPEQISGKTDTELWPPEMAVRYRAEDQEVISAGKQIIFEELIEDSEGNSSWVETIKTPLVDSAGEVVGTTGIARDITERKKIEEQQKLYARVVESTKEGVMVTDIRGTIVAVNSAFCRITGYLESELIGQNPRILGSKWQDESFYKDFWSALTKRGYWEGEMWDRRKDGALYAEWARITTVRNTKNEITHYIAVINDITERKSSEERIHYLAYHDVLTDLPNRSLLDDRLKQALIHADRERFNLAVMFIDLDGFKQINDAYGHLFGDLLLKEAARRLTQWVRKQDTVTRQGGDEFVVALSRMQCPQDAVIVAEKLRSALAEPYLIDNRRVDVSASIGVSIYPQDGKSVDTLMMNADTAMYHAKEAGRNQVKFFTPEMTAAAEWRVVIEEGLWRAVSSDELALHYQPVISSNDKTLQLVETFLHWRHPEKGLLGPSEFLPVAEESDLIHTVWEWMLSRVCVQILDWRELGIKLPLLGVNLSSRHLSDEQFVSRFSAILDQYAIPHHLFELEISEQLFMQRGRQGEENIRQLGARGVGFSIDCYGSACSSLLHLKSLPVRRLKIDHMLISEMLDDENVMAVVSSIITLGRSLGHAVVAEGVHTQEQFEALQRLGCDQIQGVLTGSPVLAADLPI
jgi:diguanylate cyclase (GGDEF)-like protein/PAS domain S-box-containing protein